jgi:hypothetical protein
MSTLVVWRVPRLGRWTIQPQRAVLAATLGSAFRKHRTLKLVALGYVVKTLVFVAAWYVVPDLPQRLFEGAQAAWERLGLNR